MDRRILGLAALLVVPFVAGCREKGPAEKVGERVDEVRRDTGKSLEDAADDVEDAVDRERR